MSTRPTGLGRGLGSLIPGKRTTSNSDSYNSSVLVADDSPLRAVLDVNEKIMELPVEKIKPSAHQPRKKFDEVALNGLADSILEHGIIQPLIVVRSGTDGYELVAGERRLKAAKIAGLKTVPAVIRDFSEQKKMELALIENLQREDLNALEIAIAYRKLMDEFNLSLEAVSKKVGKSSSAVNNYLRMLTLRSEVQEAILEGKLTEGHARTLAGLPFEDQLEGMKRIIDGKMTVREAEKAAKDVVVRKNLRPAKFDPEVRAMEEQLAGSLGTKIEIRRHGGVGQITIKFFSNEELREIVEKIS